MALRLFSSIATIVRRSSKARSGDNVQVKVPILSSMEFREERRPRLISRSKSDEQNTKPRLATKIFFSRSDCMNFVKFKVFNF